MSGLLASSLLVVLAGVSLAFQQILNANVRAHLGSPWWAGVVSYTVGLAFMLLVAVLAPGPRLAVSALGNGSWVIWLGGFFGAVFIATGILMVPRMGAATVLALVVVGQMLGSLVFDHFGLLGVPQHPVSLARMAGAVLLFVGVVLVRT